MEIKGSWRARTRLRLSLREIFMKVQRKPTMEREEKNNKGKERKGKRKQSNTKEGQRRRRNEEKDRKRKETGPRRGTKKTINTSNPSQT